MQPATDYSTAGTVAPAATDEDVGKLRRKYIDWSSAKHAEIEEMRQARHYYHGDQWTSAEIAILKKRRQPVITFNRTSRKIDGIVGVLEKLWQDAKAYPRTPGHDEGAELGTQAIRYALDQARWRKKGSEATRHGARDGIGCLELLLEQGDKGDPEIGLGVVDPDTFFYDPRSFRDDFSDARYMGVAKWLDLDVAKALYPDKADDLDGLISSGGDVETWAQQDRERRWIDVEQKRVRVIEIEYLEGQSRADLMASTSLTQEVWHVCHFSANVKLAGGVSPFVDEKGKSQSKFLAFSAFVDHDGDRYGFVRNLKSPQDELNMRRSKALHLLNTRRMIFEKGAFDDVEKARSEAYRPDGAIEHRKGFKFEFEDAAKQAEWQGQMEMLAEAKAEIENLGPTLVEKGMEKSGRAIQLLQQAGLAELGPFISAWKDWKLRVYRAVWNAIHHHWTAERWIRVTDSEGVAQFIQLNGMTIDELGQPRMVNAIGSLDVDILLDEGPDTVNTMQDVFELLESLAAAGVPIPPKVVIEMSSLPGSLKKRVVQMLEEAQQPDPMVEQAKMAALEQEQSKTALNKAGAMEKVAGAAAKWADVATKPEQLAQDQRNADMKREQMAERNRMGAM